MVWSARTEAELPPPSVILPRLYLGAQSDVTQECLSSLNISHVLSVCRVGSRPSFVPERRFLRVPIDDSLWAELLPWIPEALDFIDAARSCGASVLLHCAAGVSRSAALTVAYVMYHLDLDLDQAYRLVKERRPSISPNFNFLGQLQHFQDSLSLRAGSVSPAPPSDPWPPGGRPQTHPGPGVRQEEEDLRQVQVSGLWESSTAAGPRPAQVAPPAAAGPASLLEKRRSLTLSLSPLGGGAPAAPPSGRGTVAPKQPLLPPLGLTLNKLLGWGERLLGGALFTPAVRMGRPAQPPGC